MVGASEMPLNAYAQAVGPVPKFRLTSHALRLLTRGYGSATHVAITLPAPHTVQAVAPAAVA